MIDNLMIEQIEIIIKLYKKIFSKFEICGKMLA